MVSCRPRERLLVHGMGERVPVAHGRDRALREPDVLGEQCVEQAKDA